MKKCPNFEAVEVAITKSAQKLQSGVKYLQRR